MKPHAIIYKPLENKFNRVLSYELHEGEKHTHWLQMPAVALLKSCFNRGIRLWPESVITKEVEKKK